MHQAVAKHHEKEHGAARRESLLEFLNPKAHNQNDLLKDASVGPDDIEFIEHNINNRLEALTRHINATTPPHQRHVNASDPPIQPHTDRQTDGISVRKRRDGGFGEHSGSNQGTIREQSGNK